MTKANKHSVNRIILKYRPLFIVLVEVIVFSILHERFLTTGNIMNILKQVSINGILAAGVCFAILLGGIDISVGAVVGFSGALCARLIVNGCNVFIVLLVALAIGAVAGFFNGFFIARCHLQPMIVTLATMSIFSGATLVFTNGATESLGKSANAMALKTIGQGNIFGVIPVPVIVMLVVFAVAFYLLNETSFGRHVYAIGGNEDASYLSGINVIRVKIICHTICGLLAGLAGVVLVARVGSAQPTAGDGYEMDAIAAAVIGGTSLRGGEGHILFAMVGAIIIGVLNNILNLKNVTSYWQTVVKGVVILLAVLLDMSSKKKD